jgi:hypothetical protein
MGLLVLSRLMFMCLRKGLVKESVVEEGFPGRALGNQPNLHQGFLNPYPSMTRGSLRSAIGCAGRWMSSLCAPTVLPLFGAMYLL